MASGEMPVREVCSEQGDRRAPLKPKGYTCLGSTDFYVVPALSRTCKVLPSSKDPQSLKRHPQSESSLPLPTRLP